MLRPIYLDLFDVILPLGASIAALAGGRFLDRLPPYAFRTVIGLAVALVVALGISYFTPLHGTISDAFWHIGGVTGVACACAMLLLGVVWTSRGRSTSTGFLRVVVGLVLLIVLLDSGGRLWWRFVGTSAWENVPDAEGCVRQSSGWTCSPASAAMLLHHYGIASSEGELAYLAGTNYLGTDAPSIAYALNKKAEPKFRAHVAEISYDACIRFEMPFLAAVHVPGLGGHMVLVLRVHEDHVALIDPRFGLKQKPRREEFEGQFEKKIVYLTDGN